MSTSVQNNAVLNVLAQYGCKCLELYATSVLVISFKFLKLCMFDFLTVVNEWNKREFDARNLNESNTKHCGRGRLDMDILVACGLIRIILGLSELQLVQRSNNDNFVRAALCALIGRQISYEDLLSYSTLQKHQSQWANDQIISKALEKFNKRACMLAKAHIHQKPKIMP